MEIFDTLKEILFFKLFSYHKVEITLFDIAVIIGLLFGIRAVIALLRSRISKKFLANSHIDDKRQQTIIQLTKYFLYVVYAIVSMEIVNIDISILLAGSAALLVGVGLGIQQTFNDLISGLVLLFEGKVNVGDIVEMNGLVGKITKIGLRTSEIETRDGIGMIIPNSKLVVDNIINWSMAKQATRFKVSVGVAYGSDVEQVKKTLLACAKKIDIIIQSPPPFVRFINFGDSSLDFELYFWSEEMWSVENIKSDVRFLIDAEFRKHNIAIPFPQRDLHIISDAGAIPTPD